MNIAFITPEYITEQGFDGGLANYLYKVSKALQNRGHNIFIIVGSHENRSFIHDDINVIRVNLSSKWLTMANKLLRGRLQAPLTWLMNSKKLNIALKVLHTDKKIDVAQFASYTAPGFFRPKSIPSICRISSFQPMFDKAHGLSISRSRSLQYYLEVQALKKSDAIFGPSQLIGEIISQEVGKAVKIIESPLSSKIESDDQMYNDYLVNKKYMLFFGTLGLIKGVKDIADILPELLAQNKDLYFVFVGKNTDFQGKPMMDYVWHKAADERGRCLYLGSLRQEFLQTIIEKSLAVVLPSHIDNFPNTCIESMSKSKIVIGTRGASFEQLIDDRVNGFLCDIESPKSLLKSINKVLQLDVDEKARIEKNAGETTNRLKPDLIAEQLEDFYHKVINS